MTTLLQLPADTLADVVARLGGVPLERILAHPAPGTATETDVVTYLEATNKRLVELVDGTLVEKPMGQKESFLALYLGGLVQAFAIEHDLAWVSGMDGAARMQPGNVRIPDISVFPWVMFPDGQMDDEKIASVCPWLGVEVLSESNTPDEMAKKLKEYFASGMREAWIVDPETKSVRVYSSAKRFKTLTTTDTLTGGKILPGFTCELAKLFGISEHRRRKS